jgi:hypothetical protein
LLHDGVPLPADRGFELVNDVRLHYDFLALEVDDVRPASGSSKGVANFSLRLRVLIPAPGVA